VTGRVQGAAWGWEGDQAVLSCPRALPPPLLLSCCRAALWNSPIEKLQPVVVEQPQD